MMAIPIITAVVGAIVANRTAKSNERIAQMNIDAQNAKTSSGGVVPLDNGEAIQEAKRKSIMDQIAGRGRAGTLLSDTAGNDKLGGG